MDHSPTNVEVPAETRLPAGKPGGAPAHATRREGWTPGSDLLLPLALAIVLGALVAIFAPGPLAGLTRGLVFWDTFLVVLLIGKWRIILRSSPERCRARASADDPGRVLTFLIAISGSLVGLFGAIFALKGPDPAMDAYGPWAIDALVLVTVAGGWLLMQTAYTLHYAKLYYADRESPGGLTFLGGPPDDLDFAYFAFEVGMTFQVSDVVVTERGLRRVVLLQAVMSFAYNLAIFALVINVLAGRI
jgi:uncharacterized membrane protein